MSYNDDFASIWSHLSNADGILRSMDVAGVLVEIPHQWFVQHSLQPFGRQVMDRMTWLLSVEQLYKLWRESNPKVRWKEVY